MEKYIDCYKKLKALENFSDSSIVLDDRFVMNNFDFVSNYRFILPGGLGNNDDYEYIPNHPDDYEPDVIQAMIHKKDAEISENIEFRYHVIMPRGVKKVNKVIVMLHGFNEKYWPKYLPWAQYLAEKTGKAVLLFPIAFHMNRAPSAWSDTRAMHEVSLQRKERHTNVIGSSLSNVAISTRLHNKPQRFIWSGLQTYYDVIDLVTSIRRGLHPAFDSATEIDFFTYSVGCFVGEILLMTNQNNYFEHSKLAMFCGGAVFNRLTPVSKFIIDSEANVSLYSFLVEHIESHIKRDEILRHYLSVHPEGVNFRCMLDYHVLMKHRESLFQKLSEQMYAVGLEQDKVIPYYEIINTLQGCARNIPVKVDVYDFPYPYTHEDPFPAQAKNAEEVDASFRMVFEKFASFLS